MIFLNLHIDGFGKLSNKDIELDKHINIIYGHNEAGKSTIHSFIRAMLYGLERGRGRAAKTDLFSKYEPWSHGAYGGYIRAAYENTIYRIERDFRKSAIDLNIVDETSGKNIENPSKLLTQMLNSLSEAAYTNTVSIGQLKSATDSNMALELRNYIANLNTTGNISLNITKASSYLKAQRKAFVSQLSEDAVKTYTSNLSEIKNIEEDIVSPIYKSHIKELKEQKAETADKISKLQADKEELIAKNATDMQLLKSKGLEDKQSIADCKSSIETNYADYNKLYAKAKSKSVDGCIALSFIAACISLLCAAYIFMTKNDNIISVRTGISYIHLFYAVWGVSILIIAADIALSAMQNKNTAACKESKAKLDKQLCSLLEDDNLSSTSVTDAYDKLDSFNHIYNECANRKTDIESIAVNIDMLNSKQSEFDTEIENENKSQWELEKQLEHLTTLKDENVVLKKAIEENDRLHFEIDSIDLALETMSELSSTIRDSFGLYLNKEASELVNGITGGIYNSMSVDEDMSVYMNTKDKLVPIDQVSSGTMDQIYLALRLASANLLQKDGERLPLIFDDSFVNYDEGRLRTALNYLADSYNSQILIFTCHQRESAILDVALKSFKLISL